ncbi:MAG TPA: hypothetical protein VMD25_04165 [Acidobacteriaceae bacterium]|nr:hypothetical protein [Acidobacteriaceae bacterium]
MMAPGPQLEHEQYEELCALATAGVLSSAEKELLAAHLKNCAECREAFAQYQAVATEGMPFLAGEFAVALGPDGFDESSALQRLMRASQTDEVRAKRPAIAAGTRGIRNRGWIRGLVAATMMAAIGIGAYWAGARSANTRVRNISALSRSALGRATATTQSLQATIEADSRKIEALEQQTLADQSSVEKLRAQTETDGRRLAQIAESMAAEQSASEAQLAALRHERDADAGRLRDAEQKYQAVEYELNTLRAQHQQDVEHLASLTTSVAGLTTQLNNQSAKATEDEQYLAADKDIRDLIAARNLYIADIMDVNDTGESRKAFGRVFYTKDRSLIFYAYDLDRQPGVRQTGIFQVWGRTSLNDPKPVSLGILYRDSATQRRWTLRVNNAEQLSRLDSIFVTIEPHKQLNRPTGKPFLYASLQRLPNHP